MPYHESYAQAPESSASQQSQVETILSPETAEKFNQLAQAVGETSLSGVPNLTEKNDNVHELPIGPVAPGELEAAANQLAEHAEERDIAA